MRHLSRRSSTRLGWLWAAWGVVLVCSVSASAAPEGRRALAQARRQVAVERRAMDQLRRISQAAQTGKTEWVAAQDKLRASQNELERLRRSVLEGLSGNPIYRKQVRDCREAEEQADALRNRPDTSRQQLLATARQLLAMRGETRRMEAQALDTEPRIKELQLAVADASATLQRLREEQQESLRTSPAWQAARQRLASAEQSARTAAKAVERSEKEEWDAAYRRAQSVLASLTQN